MDTIGVRIRKIREERGIKQEFIAEQMGIGQSTYSRLEKDDNRLTATKLIKFSEILNVPVSVLFGESTTNTTHENTEEEEHDRMKIEIQHNRADIASLTKEMARLADKMELMYKILK
ncbi:MAG: helix-turn-helix domain-containing protein [Tannerella sp.]|jgi:transcriptional regulator with XRE-family HTH domain|nr:helix-turn-helix domain-containing protein [Tannerella sp.]